MDYYPTTKSNPFSVKIAENETIKDLHYLIADSLLKVN
jgi:hypothetical protein